MDPYRVGEELLLEAEFVDSLGAAMSVAGASIICRYRFNGGSTTDASSSAVAGEADNFREAAIPLTEAGEVEAVWRFTDVTGRRLPTRYTFRALIQADLPDPP